MSGRSSPTAARTTRPSVRTSPSSRQPGRWPEGTTTGATPWRRTIDTNLIGPANLIHAAVPHMVAAGGGRIVHVPSRDAFRGEPDHAAYGASKAGLNSLASSMARALAPHGIYVT